MFVTFLSAYYQWLEQSHQQLTISDVSSINVGDVVKQSDVEGVVLAVLNETNVIVQLNGYAGFTPTSESETRALIDLPDDRSVDVKQVSRFNVTHWARHIPETRDIDTTLDEFILQFKNKYLSDVQFTTASNKQLFIKNALDFYRAKGTPRAVDLFFKLIYGFGANIYYPGRDLFRPSDNMWNNSTYVEIETKTTNKEFVGRTIYGSLSGAEAFASAVVRVRNGSQEITVLYFTNLRGTFVTTENIFTKDLTNNVGARVIGSLSSFVVNRSDSDFDVGETVKAISGDGRSALGRVRATEADIGVIRFEFESGGWGYTEAAEVIGSEYVLTLSDVQITSDKYYFLDEPIDQFETARQNLIKIEGPDIDPPPPVGTDVVFSSAVPTEVISGTVARATLVDGVFTTLVDVPSDPEDLVSSIASATISGTPYIYDTVEDVSNVVEILDTRRTYNLQYAVQGSSIVDINQRLQIGDLLHQDAVINGVSRRFATVVVEDVDINVPLGIYLARVRRIENTMRTDLPFYNERLGDTIYTTTTISLLEIGVDTISINTLVPNAKLRTDPSRSGVIANVTGVFSYTNKADFAISGIEATHMIPSGWTPARVRPTLDSTIGAASYLNSIKIDGPEVSPTPAIGSIVTFFDVADNVLDTGQISRVEVNTGILSLFVYTPSDPGVYVANVDHVKTGDVEHTYTGLSVISAGVGFTSTVAEYAAAVAQPFEDVIIGQIEDIVVTNPGRGYPVDPFFIIYDPRVGGLQRYDYVIHYTPAARNFIVGERIFVRDREFLAEIVRHDRDAQFIYATRLHLGNITSATDTSNDLTQGEVIEGESTGIAATVDFAFEHRTARRIGRNAVVNAESIDGEGFATVVEVIDSGFGYLDEQSITLESLNDSSKRIEVTGYLGQYGIGQGYHSSARSFLSSDKYLHDNDYFQEYSYEIRAPLPFAEYSQTVRDVLHVAGTKPFGKYVATNEVSITLSGEAIYGQIEGHITRVFDGGNANPVVTNTIDGQDAASPRTETYDGGDVYRETT